MLVGVESQYPSMKSTSSEEEEEGDDKAANNGVGYDDDNFIVGRVTPPITLGGGGESSEVVVDEGHEGSSSTAKAGLRLSSASPPPIHPPVHSVRQPIDPMAFSATGVEPRDGTLVDKPPAQSKAPVMASLPAGAKQGIARVTIEPLT